MTYREARDKHPELEELRGLIEDEIKVINTAPNALNAIYEEVCEGLYSPLDHNPTRDWFEYEWRIYNCYGIWKKYYEETDSYNRIEEPSYLERYCNFTIG